MMSRISRSGLFFVVVIGFVLTAANQAVDTQFTVEAGQTWQSTGIVLDEDDVVTIQYLSGAWRSQPDEGWHGPEGGSSYICYGPSCVEPLPGFPKGGLVGRIGKSQVFAVSRGLTFIIPQSGDLELRINDVGVYDAEGSVTMQISVFKATPYM